jgi:hypothetical protein
MGRAYSTPGREDKCVQSFGMKTWKKETVRNTLRTLEGIIKRDLWEIGSDGVDWIHVAQDREHGGLL